MPSTTNHQSPIENPPPVPALSGSSSLYSPYFTDQERNDLKNLPPDDLTGEIHLQRALLILMQERFPTKISDFNLLLEVARVTNIAIRSLLTLIYAQSENLSQNSWAEQMIEEAYHIAATQMGVYDYLSTAPAGSDPKGLPDL